MDWVRILAYTTGTLDQELLLRSDYLAAENRILKPILTTRVPNGIVTDKLGGYRVARRELISTLPHDTNQYANNLYEPSHRATCKKGRQMKRFRTVATAQKYFVLRGLVRNLVDWGRHAISPGTYRHFRANSCDAWAMATCA
ncbi:MAG: transposase-like protein [Gammaproteobacteria bacterium]|jgi:transposase-like protein